MMLSKDVFSFSQGLQTRKQTLTRQSLVTRPAATTTFGVALLHVIVLGGIIAAPVLSLLGWVGLVLPASAPLHQAAASLITGALIWLALGIIGAHTLRVERKSSAD